MFLQLRVTSFWVICVALTIPVDFTPTDRLIDRRKSMTASASTHTHKHTHSWHKEMLFVSFWDSVKLSVPNMLPEWHPLPLTFPSLSPGFSLWPVSWSFTFGAVEERGKRTTFDSRVDFKSSRHCYIFPTTAWKLKKPAVDIERKLTSKKISNSTV